MTENPEEILAALSDRVEPLRRRHHVVPKFYLNHFAQDEVIGIWDTQAGTLRKASTTDAAVIKDFYMLYDEAGTRYDLLEVEVLDRMIEAPTSPVLSQVLETGTLPTDDNERTMLSRFVGFQAARGQRFPIPVENAMVEVARLHALMAADLIDQGHEVPQLREAIKEVTGHEPTKEDYAEFVEAARSPEDYRIKVSRPAMLRTYFGLAERLANLLLDRHWQLVSFDDPVLITSDEPVWLEWENTPGPYGEGFATVPSVWMPLSPTTALRMVRSDLELPDPASVDPDWLNKGVVGQSFRFLYGDPDLLEQLSFHRILTGLTPPVW